MADRERNDLRRQIVAMRRVLEAHERRRTQLQRRERPHGVRLVTAAFGSGTRSVRERPVRLLVVAGAVLLGVAGSVAPSPVQDDDPRRPSIAAPPEAGRDVPAEADVTLSMTGSDGGQAPGVDPSTDPAPGDGADEQAEGARAASPDGSASRDPGQGPTGDGPSGPATDGETASAPNESTSEPELSDTGDTDSGTTSEPEATESPEPEPTESAEPEDPDGDDADDGTCVGVNALGLTVDLCLPS